MPSRLMDVMNMALVHTGLIHGAGMLLNVTRDDSTHNGHLQRTLPVVLARDQMVFRRLTIDLES